MAVILLIYMWIIFSFNTNNGDYWTYYTIYNAVKGGSLRWHFEPLFSLLMQICAFAGMDFFGFKAMLGLISGILLYHLFHNYSKAPALALSYFMLFPFLFNVSVLRAGISGLIVCTAFCQYSDKRSYPVFRYLFSILIATLFHYSAIFFALLILFERICKAEEIIIISLIISVTAFAFVYSGLAYRILSAFSSREKSLQWLSTALYPHLNLTGMTFVTLTFFGNYAVSRISFETTRRYAAPENQKHILLARRALAANSGLMIFLPFALMTDVLLRYVFEFMAVNIAVLSTTVALRFEHSCKERGSICIQNICILLWLVFLLLYSTLPYLGTDISAFNTLYNNLIFGQKVPF